MHIFFALASLAAYLAIFECNRATAEANLCRHRSTERSQEVGEAQRHELVEGADLISVLDIEVTSEVAPHCCMPSSDVTHMSSDCASPPFCPNTPSTPHALATPSSGEQ